MNNPRARNFVYVLILVAIAGLLIVSFRNQGSPSETYSLIEVAEAIENNQVDRVTVDGNVLQLEFRDGTLGEAQIQDGSNALEQLAALGVGSEELRQLNDFAVKSPSQWTNFIPLLSLLLPAVFIVLIIYFMMRQVQGGNNQAMNFGKSKARMVTGDHPTVTFDDVAGQEESKEELAEIVEFLKEPEKFIALGARIPKGVLLVGSPGTGKTLLAKAVSGEAGVPFFSISGSEFVEMFVGVGASRVRDLFEQAKRHSPCIIFIDEIDAVGRSRGAGLGGSHDEREQTLNQILVEMDGFDTDTNVIIVAATNRPDILDPALMRPGRFDRRVVIDRPDVRGREAILKVHTRGKPLDNDVDLRVLAKSTPGFVGADIENMVNEAAILAARYNKKSIGMEDLENAIERVIMGPERKSRVISAKEKKVIAYHEAGHAIAARELLGETNVRKVTIVSRGMAGGYMWAIDSDEDEMLRSRSQFKNQLVIALGGRVAEEIVFDEITSGAASDLENVAKTARTMVMRLGMSDKLAQMSYGQQQQMVFLGRDLGEQRDYSEATAEMIDAEVRQLVDEAYEQTRKLLSDNRDKLDLVAEALQNHETLDNTMFETVFAGGQLPEKEEEAPAASAETDTPPAEEEEASDDASSGTQSGQLSAGAPA